MNTAFLFWLPLLPFLGAIAIGVFTRKKIILSGWIAIAVSLAVCIMVIESGTTIFPWRTQAINPISATKSWIPNLQLNAYLVLDSFAGWMIMMTTLTMLTGLVYMMFIEPRPSWKRLSCILIIFSGAIGVFLARDALSLLFAWGTWLIVPFFVDSRHADKKYASGRISFFIFHLLSLLLLAGALGLAHFMHFSKSGLQGFDMATISRLPIPESAQLWLFALTLVCLAIRMALFPFHTWLIDAITEFPATISAFLIPTGLATSIYTMLRICLPLCPDMCIKFNKYAIFAALLSMIYGAMVALMNPHLLHRLGFATQSYSGLMLLGLFTLNDTGFVGALLTAANFIPTMSILILAINWITSRTETDLMQDVTGIRHKFPLISIIAITCVMALSGIPGLSMFSGLFLIIAGVIQIQPVWAFIALAAFLILSTGSLWMFQKIFTGKPSPLVAGFNPADNLTPGRILIPLTALILWFGFFPQYMIHSFMDQSETINRHIQSHRILKQTEPVITPLEHFFQQKKQRQ
ncbi:MAG: proton-conducting transporter membrane subunit [bacterium]